VREVLMPLTKSRHQRGKENVPGKIKIPWKNPLQGKGGTDFAFAKVSVKKAGLHVGIMFRF